METERNLDVKMAGVLVEVPDRRVVAVRDEKSCYPLAPPRLTPPPGDHSRH